MMYTAIHLHINSELEFLQAKEEVVEFLENPDTFERDILQLKIRVEKRLESGELSNREEKYLKQLKDYINDQTR